jgi:hypothetical protein
MAVGSVLHFDWTAGELAIVAHQLFAFLLPIACLNQTFCRQ